MIANISWWWWLLFLIASVGMAFLLYYREKSLREWKPWQKILMFSLRFLFIFIIFTLLFAPLIKTNKRISDKPVVVIAQDNSSSVCINSDSLYYRNVYSSDLQKLVNRLSENYHVVRYTFGDAVRSDSLIDFSDASTRMADIFPVITAAYAGMNLGAIIVAGDGIYNQGENPVYSQKPPVAIYTVALGDTLPSKDVYIREVQHNKAAFYKNRFPVRIMLSADKCKGENLHIEISGSAGKLFEKDVLSDSDDFMYTVDAELEASPKGLQEYKVSVSQLKGEISTGNNTRIFVVDVVDNRKNILFLANGSHPDLGAMVFALKNNPDYSITTASIAEFSGKIDDYQFVVLHQLPSLDNAASQVMKQLSVRRIPALYILGARSSVDAFNQLQTGLKIVSAKTSSDEASPVAVSGFSAFTVDQDLLENMSSLPPLVTPFGDYKITSNAKVLMNQRISTVNTDKPLMMFIDEAGIRSGIITGEGIWRWRLHLYRLTGSHEVFDGLINRIIQYLVNTRLKQSLMVDSKRIFTTGEAVILEAEFYNEAFELRNSSELKVSVRDSSAREIKLSFERTGDYYSLNMGSMAPGRYSYSAALEFDRKTYSASGEFVVIDVSTESLVTRANHDVMYRLANENGGEMFYPSQMNALAEAIENNENIVPRVYIHSKLTNLIDLKWLFFVILLFASTEWFFRKYWGSY
ncbi:MAG TPA: hypothetical protein PLZ52_08465 [Bacteroidales bacterium]|nr:hypothetical protein [Bacteroidales bacterium]HOE05234.1 hypothetical protein [Bacteroidales bacterium]